MNSKILKFLFWNQVCIMTQQFPELSFHADWNYFLFSSWNLGKFGQSFYKLSSRNIITLYLGLSSRKDSTFLHRYLRRYLAYSCNTHLPVRLLCQCVLCGGACSPHLPNVSSHYRVVVKAFASSQCRPGSFPGRSRSWYGPNDPPKL